MKLAAAVRVGLMLIALPASSPVLSQAPKGGLYEKERPRLDALVQSLVPQPEKEKYLQIHWVLDLNKARQEAQQTGKPILMWLSAGGSPNGSC